MVQLSMHGDKVMTSLGMQQVGKGGVGICMGVRDFGGLARPLGFLNPNTIYMLSIII